MQLPTHGQWWSILRTQRLHWRQWCVRSGFGIRHRWQRRTPPCFFCSIEINLDCFFFSIIFFFLASSVLTGSSLYSLAYSWPCLDTKKFKSKSMISLGYIKSLMMSSLSNLSCSRPNTVSSLLWKLPLSFYSFSTIESGRSYSRSWGTPPGSVLIVNKIAMKSCRTRNMNIIRIISTQKRSFSFSSLFAQ